MSSHSYHSVVGHMEGHKLGRKLKEWLREFCKREGAHTIGRAVERVDHERLQRRLARALTDA